MKQSFLLFILISAFFAYSQDKGNVKPSIIPEPVSLIQKQGSFNLKPAIVINIVNPDAEAENVAEKLSKALERPTGYKVTIRKNALKGTINLNLLRSADPVLGTEGYLLSITPQSVTISANKAAGLFYGMQSLLQLLPKEIESKTVVSFVKWTIPCVEVKDYPRFGWRGLMFDVSRHFFTKEQVKDYIDQMVKFKLNLLHLHLTDDEGWRIEIKSLPKLTSVGAWNVKMVGTFGNFPPPSPDAPRDYGGFFTQDDIRELVQYAGDHFVNILPEVDVPGHSLAAIASYPELSCTPGAEKYQVRSGEKIMEWPANGHFYGLVDNTLCPANEKVYTFLDKVFTEIAQLFPFEYIHVGGDECAHNFWEKSDAIKALMQKENLKNLDEVQGYFEKRVEKIVASKGKKIIGWDEILEGGLAPNAVVMSWRGIKGGIEAAKMGHEVVMSPTTFAYLDYMQGDASLEPPVYATLRLNKTYEFEPVPDGVDAKFIKGGQGNLWTEQVYNMRHAEYMTWPRGLAIAEAVWSQKAKRNWENFSAKVENQFTRFDFAGIKYAPSMYDPIVRSKPGVDSSVIVEMETEIKGLDIYYSFDNSFPDLHYPKYVKPIIVPKESSLMKIITYRNGKPIGRIISIPVSSLKKRAGISN